MYAARKVFIVSYVAVFAFEIFWFWWDGWGLAGFCNLNEKRVMQALNCLFCRKTINYLFRRLRIVRDEYPLPISKVKHKIDFRITFAANDKRQSKIQGDNFSS